MAKLPGDLDRLISTAIDTADAFGAALHASPMDDTDLALEFQDRETAERFRMALLAQRHAYLSLSNGMAAVRDALRPGIVATTELEASPTKPLDVEVRQWALALALQVYASPFDEASMLMRERAADRFVKYAMTGTTPPSETKPEDPA